MSNSSLVSYVKLSPHYWQGRKYPITRITPHCVVGQCTVQALGNVFSGTRQCSSNYGIGRDGKVAMYVAESNSAQTSSSYDNDNRAVTIECASDATAPFAFNATVYKRLVELCTDICRRNGKKRLLWFPNKNTALSYRPAADEMVLTVHRWFSPLKSCPGDWMYARMGDLAKQVTANLSGSTSKPATSTKPVTRPTSGVKAVKASGVARKFSKSLAGSYTTTDDLNMRDDAGTKHSILVTIPKGTKVQCYGYYSLSGVYKWLYVVARVGGVWYTGFVSKAYLK